MQCYQKSPWNAFLPKAIHRGPDPLYFPRLVQSVYSPASYPILSRDCQALESVQKLAVKFVKRLRHVPYETALQRLQLFSLVCRRIRGDLIWKYKIMHGLLTVFAAPTRIGLRGHTFEIHQQRCKTRRRQHAFSVRVVPYWNKLPEEKVTATSMETVKFRLDARWQSLFPGVPL